MEDYEKLLEEAYSKVTQVEGTGERFEIPKIEGHFEGKKTILTNFNQVAAHIRRDPEHFKKYLSRELATPIIQEKDKTILNKKISSKQINPKIEQYVKDFVICRECGKPDTQIEKEDRTNFLHCLACGAKHPIRN